jgi:DNA-binding CsgD family transcriptional regulator
MKERLASLAPAHKRAIEVAAVIGTTFSLADLAAVVDEPVGRVLGELQEALDDGLIVPDGDSVSFVDPVDREAVVRGVAVAIRLGLHREIGQRLLERGGSNVAAASHLVRGARPGDRQALDSLDRAIDGLAATDPAAAVEFAIDALDLSEIRDANRLRRGRTAADALMAAGRIREARELAESLLRGPGRDAASRAGLQLVLGLVGLLDARPDDAIHTVAPILATTGLDDELYGAAQVIHLFADIVAERLEPARRRADAILAGADRTGGDSALPEAIAGIAYIEWVDGRVEPAIGLLRAAIERSEHAAGQRSVIAQLGLIAVLASGGLRDDAIAVADGARRTIESAHQPAWSAGISALSARMHLLDGDQTAAKGEAEAALTSGADMGLRLFDAAARLVQMTILLQNGDLSGASRASAAIEAEPPAGRAVLGRRVHRFLEAGLREAEAGPAAALELLGELIDDPSTDRRVFSDLPASAPWLVRVALAADRGDAATAVVSASHWLASANPGLDVAAASASQAEGLLRADPERLIRAAAQHRHPWAQASAEEDAGRALLPTDAGAAIGHLGRALELYVKAGARRDARRIRSRLAHERKTSGVSRVRRPPAGGWDSLSPAELRVATTVGSGLTNAQSALRLSLSPHTVDFHLRSIFEKLGIRSRAGLVRIATTRDAVREAVDAADDGPPSVERSDQESHLI